MINRVSFILALLGVLLTIHLWIQKQRSFDQGCLGFSRPEIQQTISSECQEVVESEAGNLFGVNNILLGFFFYVAVGALGLGTVFAGSKIRTRLLQATLGRLICVKSRISWGSPRAVGFRDSSYYGVRT